jgi:hypothetical protein
LQVPAPSTQVPVEEYVRAEPLTHTAAGGELHGVSMGE